MEERAAAHNARQDAALAELCARAADAATAAPRASPSAFVRRRRADEAPPPSSGEGGGGIEAREETADALVAALAAVTPTELVRVGRLCDAPLVCPFTNACFAQVCVERGLLVLVPPLLRPRSRRSSRSPSTHSATRSRTSKGTCSGSCAGRGPSCPDDASPLERARLHLTVAYTVNSLYWMYLRASG